MNDQPLRELAPETKALVLIREYLSGHLHPSQLGSILDELLNSPDERTQVLEQFAAGMRQQKVDEPTIDSLLELWSHPTDDQRPPAPDQPLIDLVPMQPGGQAPHTQGAPVSPGAESEVTRKIRGPHVGRHRDFAEVARQTPLRVQLSDLPKRVLLADDDHRIRMVYKVKFEERGWEVLEAGTGLDAWKLIERSELGGIVLDMKLPGMHGLEILSRLCDAGRYLPVVISTAYDHLKHDLTISNYPLLKYLTKPVSPALVVASLGDLQERASRGI